MNDFKVGDKIVFCKGKKNKYLEGVTIGKIYTLSSEDENGVRFKDDAGQGNYSASLDGDGKATKIID